MEILTKGLEQTDVKSNLQTAVDECKVIRIMSYAMSADVESTLDEIISKVLGKYHRMDLKSLVYTCVKELAINGTKANLKRIFFTEKNLDLNEETQYEKGLALYKKMMTENKALQYGKKAKEQGLFVKISFQFSEKNLRIEVLNNTGVTPWEEERLREKLAKTMQYDDLMQYYMDNADDTEGSGMGLALIIILMKGENIDPNGFHIKADRNRTLAWIDIPLAESS